MATALDDLKPATRTETARSQYLEGQTVDCKSPPCKVGRVYAHQERSVLVRDTYLKRCPR